MIEDPFDATTCRDVKRCISQAVSAAQRRYNYSRRAGNVEDMELLRKAIEFLESESTAAVLTFEPPPISIPIAEG